MTALILLELLVTAVGIPLISLWLDRRFERNLEAGNADARLMSYKDVMIFLWSMTAVVLADLFVSNIPFAAIGLHFSFSQSVLIGLGVTVILLVVMVMQHLHLLKSPEAMADVEATFTGSEGIRRFMPRNETEYSRFNLVSITAGITEEIIFRGYIIWALSLVMPIWAAAVLSLVSFVAAHAYQGISKALMGVVLTGAALTLITILSGSLLPAIILHIAIDLNSNLICRLVNNKASA